jgi:hypothetical protein
MLKNNAPCKCKHSNANHLAQHFQLVGDFIETVLGCSVKYCVCHEFELDNLRYLEKEYDAKSREQQL